MFVIDTSTYLGLKNFRRVKHFVKNVVRYFRIAPRHVRVGALTYSTSVRNDFNLKTYKNLHEVLRAIDRIPYIRGQDYTNRALAYLRKYSFTLKRGARRHVVNVAIVITNGRSKNLLWTTRQADYLKRKDVKVFVVAIGKVYMLGVERIASVPYTWFVVRVPNYRVLERYAWALIYRLYWNNDRKWNLWGYQERLDYIRREEMFFKYRVEEWEKIRLPGYNKARMDIMFVVDASTSVGLYNFMKVKSFMKKVVKYFHIAPSHVRVGAITYSTWARDDFNLNSYKTLHEVLRAIDSIPYVRGQQYTNRALSYIRRYSFTRRYGTRPHVVSVAIVITNGRSVNHKWTTKQAELLRRDDVKVFVVAVGKVYELGLRRISSRPHSWFIIRVPNYRLLERYAWDLVYRLYWSFDKRWILKGYKERLDYLEEKEIVSEYKEKVRKHFKLKGYERARLDIMFVLDSSSFLGLEDFKRTKDFVKNVVKYFRIAPNHIRVGVITYSTWVKNNFNLNSYKNLIAVLRAIDRIPYVKGQHYTSRALSYLRVHSFTEKRGVRHHVVSVAVVITNGKANNIWWTADQAKKLKHEGVKVFVVAIGKVDMAGERRIASQPTDWFIVRVPRYRMLARYAWVLAYRLYWNYDSEWKMKGYRERLEYIEGESTYHYEVKDEWKLKGYNKGKLDIMFVIDTSTYVGLKNFRRVKNFVKNVVRYFRVAPRHVRVGALTYSTLVKNNFDLNKYKNMRQVLRAIDRIPYKRGKQYTNRALSYLRRFSFTLRRGARRYVVNVAIIITNGQSNNHRWTIREAGLLKRKHVKVFVVAIGKVYLPGLKTITSFPHKWFIIRVPKYEDLRIYSWIMAYRLYWSYDRKWNMRGYQKAVDYMDIIEDRAYEAIRRKHAYEVLRKWDVRGYYTARMSIMFVLDSSVDKAEFRRIKMFAKSVIRYFNISPRFVRVGVLAYSTAIKGFDLNHCKTMRQLFIAIDKIPYRRGEPRLGATLRYLRKYSFLKRHGARPDIVKIAVIITNGKSMKPKWTSLQAKYLKRADVKVFVVAPGEHVDMTQIVTMAGVPHRWFILRVPQYRMLEEYALALAYRIYWGFDRNWIMKEYRKSLDVLVPPKITFLKEGYQRAELDIMFVLDSSSFIGIENFKRTKDFIKKVIKFFRIAPRHVRVGVITYSTHVRNNFNLDSYKNLYEVLRAVDKIPYIRGQHYTSRALSYLREYSFTERYGARRHVVSVAIVITNGKANNIWWTADQAKKLKREGVKVFVVAIGKVDMAGERRIASVPADWFIVRIPGYSMLERYAWALASRLYWNYDRRWIMKGYQEKLEHVENEEKFHYEVRDIWKLRGYNTGKLDIMFVIDTSTYVGLKNFRRVKNFVKNVVRYFRVAPRHVRVGALTYSTLVKNNFDLNKYKNMRQVLRAIDRIPYKRGKQYTNRALSYLRRFSFTLRRGARRYVVNVAIIITNGQSNNHRWTIREAGLLKRKHVKVFVVAIGKVYLPGLKTITSFPHKWFIIRVPKYEDLRIYSWIMAYRLYWSFNTKWTLKGYQEKLKFMDRKIHYIYEERERRSTFKVLKKWDVRGYYTARMSIMFVLDSSVDKAEFRRIKMFAKSVIRYFNISPRFVRVGVLAYSTAIKGFDLNHCKTMRHLFIAIDKIPYRRGEPRLGATLRYLRKYSFLKRHGARPDIVKIAVIITNGKSMKPKWTSLQAKYLKRADVKVFVVAPGEHVDMTQIVTMAGVPHRWFILRVPQYRMLEEYALALAYRIYWGFDRNWIMHGYEKKIDILVPPKIPFLREGYQRAELDIMFVLDSSSFIGIENFKRTKDFVKKVIKFFRIAPRHVRVGVITYSTHVRNNFNLDSYKNLHEVLRAVDRIPYVKGQHYTSRALSYLREYSFTEKYGARRHVVSVAIVITNGKANNLWWTADQAKLLKRKDVKIFVVAIGKVDMAGERRIASYPMNWFIVRVPKYKMLGKYAKVLATRMYWSYDRKWILKGYEKRLSHMDNKVKYDYDVETRWKLKGYETARLDIMFVIDTSIGLKNFRKVKDFVKNVVRYFRIAPRHVRVGAISYSTRVRNDFNLNSYKHLRQVLRAIDRIPYVKGKEYTNRALKYLRKVSFTRRFGARPDIVNVAIVITNGKSNNPMGTTKQADFLKLNNVKIFVVAIGKVDMTGVERIASLPYAWFIIKVPSYEKLRAYSWIMAYRFYWSIDKKWDMKGYLKKVDYMNNQQYTYEQEKERKYIYEVLKKWDVRGYYTARMNIMFILDSSVGEVEFKRIKMFAKSVIRYFNVSPKFIRIGVLAYSTAIKGFDLSHCKDMRQIFWAIDKIPYTRGEPHLGAALKYLREYSYLERYGGRPDIVKVAVIITNGKSMKPKWTSLQAKHLKREGVKVFVVAPGEHVEMTQIKNIASHPYDWFILRIPHYKLFEQYTFHLIFRIYWSFDHRWNMHDYKQGLEFVEKREERIEVLKAWKVRGYFTARINIMFVLDSAVTKEHFQKIKNFAKSVIRYFNISPESVKVGVLAYSNKIKGFDLNKCKNMRELFLAIDKLPYMKGKPRLGATLKFLRKYSYLPKYGGRPGIMNIAIVVTNGKSMKPKWTALQAKKLKHEGVKVFVIAPGKHVDMKELKYIASRPSDFYIKRVPTYEFTNEDTFKLAYSVFWEYDRKWNMEGYQKKMALLEQEKARKRKEKAHLLLIEREERERERERLLMLKRRKREERLMMERQRERLLMLKRRKREERLMMERRREREHLMEERKEREERLLMERRRERERLIMERQERERLMRERQQRALLMRERQEREHYLMEQRNRMLAQRRMAKERQMTEEQERNRILAQRRMAEERRMEERPRMVEQRQMEERPRMVEQRQMEERPRMVEQRQMEERPRMVEQRQIEKRPRMVEQRQIEKRPRMVEREKMVREPEMIERRRL